MLNQERRPVGRRRIILPIAVPKAKAKGVAKARPLPPVAHDHDHVPPLADESELKFQCERIILAMQAWHGATLLWWAEHDDPAERPHPVDIDDYAVCREASRLLAKHAAFILDREKRARGLANAEERNRRIVERRQRRMGELDILDLVDVDAEHDQQ